MSLWTCCRWSRKPGAGWSTCPALVAVWLYSAVVTVSPSLVLKPSLIASGASFISSGWRSASLSQGTTRHPFWAKKLWNHAWRSCGIGCHRRPGIATERSISKPILKSWLTWWGQQSQESAMSPTAWSTPLSPGAPESATTLAWTSSFSISPWLSCPPLWQISSLADTCQDQQTVFELASSRGSQWSTGERAKDWGITRGVVIYLVGREEHTQLTPTAGWCLLPSAGASRNLMWPRLM